MEGLRCHSILIATKRSLGEVLPFLLGDAIENSHSKSTPALITSWNVPSAPIEKPPPTVISVPLVMVMVTPEVKALPQFPTPRVSGPMKYVRLISQYSWHWLATVRVPQLPSALSTWPCGSPQLYLGKHQSQVLRKDHEYRPGATRGIRER